MSETPTARRKMEQIAERERPTKDTLDKEKVQDENV